MSRHDSGWIIMKYQEMKDKAEEEKEEQKRRKTKRKKDFTNEKKERGIKLQRD